MTKTYTPDGSTITRDDGSTVYPVVYLDSNGEVAGKAYIPDGHEPDVPDHVDKSRSATVDANTDHSSLLSDSPANLPSNLQHDPADTAMEKLENVVIDDQYRGQ